MLRLQLKKSRYILEKKTINTRRRLLGQPLLPVFLSTTPTPTKRHSLYQNAQKLIHKSIKDRSNDQKIIFESKSILAAKNLVNVSVKETFQLQQPTSTPTLKKSSWSFKATAFTALMSISFALLVTLFGPIIYFRFFGHEVVPVQSAETGTPLGGEFQTPVPSANTIAQPPREESLPEGNWVVIPRIGVRTEILESEVPEESLIKGVWRVPEFGQPGDQKQPMILAAHRYGYNWWWQGEYWKYNSFYLLPDLQPGDYVEVISDKRKYLYEIYAGEEGTEITDYNADLILYTCKYLTSDIRHFRYARLIDPSKYPTSTSTSQTTPPAATPSATPAH